MNLFANKSLKYISCFCIAATTLIAGCKKDEEETPQPQNPGTGVSTGTLSIQFENVVGDSALVLANAKSYVTPNNDTFTVSRFNYYVSNIRLIKNNGDIYTEPESYHLIESNLSSSLQFSLANVPVGEYVSMEFMIGVDSARNVSGAQTGALDPINGMFWSWSTGYIQAKLEGTSPQSGSGSLVYHISGFSGIYNPLKVVSPSFNTQTATVSTSSTPVIHLKADLMEWFQSPYNINIASVNHLMSVNATSHQIAKNYSDMFSVDHIDN
jgi:hypothetical protein